MLSSLLYYNIHCSHCKNISDACVLLCAEQHLSLCIEFFFCFYVNVICVLFRVTEGIQEILDHLDIREKRYFVTAFQAGRLVHICPITLSEHICGQAKEAVPSN